MSPYIYCAGNPVMLIDPDGRDIDPATEKHVQHLIDPNSAQYNAAFAGIYNTLQNDHNTVYSFNTQNSKIENGEKIFGSLPYTGKNSSGQYLISINYITKGGTTGMSNSQSLLEETFHAYQFSKGKFGYFEASGNAFALDLHDKAEAKVFAAQNTPDQIYRAEKNLLAAFAEKGYEGVKDYLLEQSDVYSKLDRGPMDVTKYCDNNLTISKYGPNYFLSNGQSRFTNIIMQKP